MAALPFSPSFAPPPFRLPAAVNITLLPLPLRRRPPPLSSLRCSALSHAAAVQADNDEAAKFAAAAKCGNLIPLHRCIFSDHLTPVLAYRCLVKEDDRDAPSFLFESVEQGYLGTNVGRYSFVGAQPAMEIVAKENLVTIMDHEEGVRTEEIVEDPMQIPRRMMDGWSPQLIDDPTFYNLVNGQVNLRDAIRREIDFELKGKPYKLSQNPATLIVRPRGWHLNETRISIDGRPLSGSIFDFALYFFHNASYLLSHASGPYFYLPKMEHYLEARLWSDIFYFSQSYLKIPVGSIRATVLIETLPAAFQMEEILYELRAHSSGLNCGRWDYIFSFIKRRRADLGAVLPDRADVTMEVGFMDSYVRLLIQTCHKRKVAAMGGMSAQIPIKGDEAANEVAMKKVRSDKLREVTAGHDGTWIAHPLICKIAMEVFDEYMLGPNQYHVLREEVKVQAGDLLNTKVKGAITEAGVKGNVSAALSYCAAWVSGNGCIPINNLMEDAATAEIARVQLWQWVFHHSLLSTGTPITPSLIASYIAESLPGVTKIPGVEQRHADIASEYLKGEVEKAGRGEWPSEFLTSDLMPFLDAPPAAAGPKL